MPHPRLQLEHAQFTRAIYREPTGAVVEPTGDREPTGAADREPTGAGDREPTGATGSPGDPRRFNRSSRYR